MEFTAVSVISTFAASKVDLSKDFTFPVTVAVVVPEPTVATVNVPDVIAESRPSIATFTAPSSEPACKLSANLI